MRQFLAGVGFRSNTPTFREGQQVSAFVTGHNGSTPAIRIGDSVLHLDNGAAVDVDTRVRVEVTRFDESAHEGEAELIEIEGEGAF